MVLSPWVPGAGVGAFWGWTVGAGVWMLGCGLVLLPHAANTPLPAAINEFCKRWRRDNVKRMGFPYG